VHHGGLSDAALVRQALCGVGGLSGAVERGQKDADEQGDDAYDHKQLDQGESKARGSGAKQFHIRFLGQGFGL